MICLASSLKKLLWYEVGHNPMKPNDDVNGNVARYACARSHS